MQKVEQIIGCIVGSIGFPLVVVPVIMGAAFFAPGITFPACAVTAESVILEALTKPEILSVLPTKEPIYCCNPECGALVTETRGIDYATWLVGGCDIVGVSLVLLNNVYAYTVSFIIHCPRLECHQFAVRLATQAKRSTGIDSSYRFMCLGCGMLNKHGESYKLCGRCRSIRYCSTRCQSAHWIQHCPDCHPRCWECGIRPARGTRLSRCARCHKARYCSSECQRKAWPRHSHTCI